MPDAAADPQRRTPRPTRPTARASPTTRSAPRFEQWKHYRGGTASRSALYDRGHARDREDAAAGRRARTTRTRCGSATRSTSAPTATASSTCSPTTRDARTSAQLTRHTTSRCSSATAGGGQDHLRAGRLPAPASIPATGARAQADDRRRRRPPRDAAALRRAARSAIRSAALSPTGARAAFEFRGEIVTVPAEKGDERNLTDTTAAHERSPAWSPDGKRSRTSPTSRGEYRLLHRAAGRQGRAPQAITLGGAGFYERSRLVARRPEAVAYTDNSRTLYWVDVKRRKSKIVASQQTLHARPRRSATPGRPTRSGSPTRSGTQAAVMRGLTSTRSTSGKSFPVTDGLSRGDRAGVRRSGKYLYFFGLDRRRAGARLVLACRTPTCAQTRNVYLVVLRQGPALAARARRATRRRPPAATKPDDENPDRREGRGEAGLDGRAARRRHDVRQPDPAAPAHAAVPDRLRRPPDRILDVPVPAGDISNLQAGTAGQLFSCVGADGKTSLQRYDLEKRKEEHAGRRRPTSSSPPTARSSCTPAGRLVRSSRRRRKIDADRRASSRSTPSR